MDKKIFNGILQYTQVQFENVEKKPGYIYLVRSSESENDGDAEIWFGTRRYGSVDISALIERNISAVDTEDVFDDVPNDVYLKYVAQFLTEEQREQVLTNIGAVNANGEEFTYLLNAVGSIEELRNIVESNEKVTAAALVDVDTRLNNTYTKSQTDDKISEKISELGGNIYCGTF